MDDEQVRGLLGSTRMPLPAKLELLEQTLGGINPLALNFAKLLTMKGRSDLSREIFDEYMALANAERGIARGVVTTAVPISDEDRGAIERKLGEITGQQVSVSTNVDPEIIGGLIARVGDTLIDGSVRSRLLNLRRRLAT
jgi:F-type H+-transporting ATPase subunit delta